LGLRQAEIVDSTSAKWPPEGFWEIVRAIAEQGARRRELKDAQITAQDKIPVPTTLRGEILGWRAHREHPVCVIGRLKEAHT